jgi:hypothetical protein
MRYAEFKLFEEERKVYSVGDSHAEGLAYQKGVINRANGGVPSTHQNNFNGRHTKNGGPVGIETIPKNQIVLISQGANDTANSARAHMDSKGKRPLVPPATIASNVRRVVDAAKAAGHTVVFILFPNGQARAPGLAKYYSGDYQEEVRQAIKSAVGVPVVDLDGKGLSSDGIHGTPGAYKSAAQEAISLAGRSASTTPAKPDQSGKPVQPTTPGSFIIDVPKTRREPAVADVQKALLALGYKLPTHGVDGIRGRETSAAVMLFQRDNGLSVDGDPGPETVAKLNAIIKSKPELFKGLTKSTDAEVKPARGSFEKRKIDTTTIQDPDFNNKLQKIADKLGVAKSDLIAIMRLESGLDHTIQNKKSKATGLIQFMPDTARSLGTTVDELKKMSAVEQLDYVYKYFVMRGVQPGMKLGDLYLSVFWPAGVGKPNSYVIAKRGSAVYDWNDGLDVTKDGILTAGDVRRAIQARA